MHKQKYYIKGMHCASCEVVIEKKLLEIEGVEFVDASLPDGSVLIGYNQNKPSIEKLNRLFKESGYAFSEKSFDGDGKLNVGELISPALIAVAIITVFWALEKLGLSSYVNIGQGSSLVTFFGFGLLAGVSSCAALVGGLVLSLSKQWSEKYSGESTLFQKAEPHILFNFGRLFSYALFGGILGFIGQKIQLSQTAASILVAAVSLFMAIIALQMLGIKGFSKIKLALPKNLTYKIAGKEKLNNKMSPFIVGLLTFFLPCGFTLIAQGMAMISGDPAKASAIMLSFALGTFIPLLSIGLLSAKMLHSKMSDKFLKIAGFLILFFVFYNLNTQFSLTSYLSAPEPKNQNINAERPVNSQTQIIKSEYTLKNDIIPNSFTVKAGTPVRFEVVVKDNGYGCMSTIMVSGLYNSPQYLRKGQIIVMEFTPEKPGQYYIACAMGVPRGIIKVIE